MRLGGNGYIAVRILHDLYFFFMFRHFCFIIFDSFCLLSNWMREWTLRLFLFNIFAFWWAINSTTIVNYLISVQKKNCTRIMYILFYFILHDVHISRRTQVSLIIHTHARIVHLLQMMGYGDKLLLNIPNNT